jgi:predicted regulator of Ras-like GTPase activity (Roadblock/LC7/MglB family)
MLSIFKKLFSKSPEPPPAPARAPAKPSGAATVAAAPAAPAGPPKQTAAGPEDITVSLKGVIALLPDSLKKRLDRNLTGAETVWISKASALKQLPTGAVKLPFAEIVRMSPSTFLTPDAEMMSTMVNLPLGEILPKMKALPRRAEQKIVEVPEDLAPVFGVGLEEKSKAVKPVNAPVPTPQTLRPNAPMAIPAPTPKAVPSAPPKSVPVPAPEATAAPVAPIAPSAPLAKAAPSATPEAYSAPAPKALEEQATISLKLPLPTPALVAPPAPAPSAAPAPISIPTPAPAPIAMRPPQPIAAPAPIPVHLPTQAPSPVPKPAESPVIPFGDIFGQPDKADWTPQEVVEKAATLRGVAGALITTIDGLPVAFHLPTELSGNMVAAFVPQLFTRIIQYTRDLKLGEAKHITIIVENVPLQIFKSGGVYFTALGRANENLPKPQLTAIAAALGRQSQT